jgi:hypothetical protein
MFNTKVLEMNIRILSSIIFLFENRVIYEKK